MINQINCSSLYVNVSNIRLKVNKIPAHIFKPNLEMYHEKLLNISNIS